MSDRLAQGASAGAVTDDKSPAAAPASLVTHLALIAVQLCFASLSVAGKLALRSLSPFALAAARMALSASVMTVLWLLFGRERVAPRDLLRLAAYAFFGIIANQLLFLGGLSRTSATSAVVLGASIPVFTVGVALFLRREQATPQKLAGLALGLCGALLLAATGDAAGAQSPARAHVLLGNFLILANSLSFSIYLVISRDVLTRLRPFTVITFVFLFGAAGVLPFGAADLARAAPTLDAGTLRVVAFIVLFPTVISYLLNAVALRVVPASLVAIYIYLQPVVGALLAALVLDERPTAWMAAAASLIFAGIFLVNRDARRLRSRLAVAAPASAEPT